MLYLALLIGLLLSTPALAEYYPMEWRSTRYSAMGGSCHSFSNGLHSVFYNPAGVARSRNPRSRQFVHAVGFPEIEVLSNEDGLQFWQALGNDPDKAPEKFIEAALMNPGETTRTEMQAAPGIMMGGKSQGTWLVNIPMRTEFDLFADDAQDISLTMTSSTTVGMNIAYADLTRAGSFAWGVAVRPNQRYSHFSKEISASLRSWEQLQDELSSGASVTTGYPVDLGIIFTASDYWFPSFGLVVRNLPFGCEEEYENPFTEETQQICGSPRSGSLPDDAPGRAKIDPTEVRVGFSMTPRFRIGRQRLNLRVSVDMYPLPISNGGSNYGLVGLDPVDMLHAGAEFFFGNPFREGRNGLRVGFAYQQVQFGGGLNLLGLDLSYANIYDPIVGRQHMLGVTTRF